MHVARSHGRLCNERAAHAVVVVVAAVGVVVMAAVALSTSADRKAGERGEEKKIQHKEIPSETAATS